MAAYWYFSPFKAISLCFLGPWAFPEIPVKTVLFPLRWQLARGLHRCHWRAVGVLLLSSYTRATCKLRLKSKSPVCVEVVYRSLPASEYQMQERTIACGPCLEAPHGSQSQHNAKPDELFWSGLPFLWPCVVVFFLRLRWN